MVLTRSMLAITVALTAALALAPVALADNSRLKAKQHSEVSALASMRKARGQQQIRPVKLAQGAVPKVERDAHQIRTPLHPLTSARSGGLSRPHPRAPN